MVFDKPGSITYATRYMSGRDRLLEKPRLVSHAEICAPHVLVVDEAGSVACHAHAADVEDHGAPALSEMSAVVSLTISRRPSVSTAICRLRPTIFLPAS
jgi:hypothetical protein